VRDRDQLWAEAAARYRAGERWWLDTAELTLAAEQEQADRYEGDAWEGPISTWIEGKASVSTEDILMTCLEKAKGTWTAFDKTRVARCLGALGWERYKAGPRTSRQWRYRPRRVSHSRCVSQPVSQSDQENGSQEAHEW